MLIGIGGKLQAGKNTVYEIIKDLLDNQYKVEQISFAEKLKQSAAAALGITVETLERLKIDEELYYSLGKGIKLEPQIFENTVPPFNIRTYLQRYGTEAHRNIFGEDFWVDMALPKTYKHEGIVAVVTDMRFPNEMERVKELGGTTVKIIREPLQIPEFNKFHPSEQNLDTDYIIENLGSKSELTGNVIDLLSDLAVEVKVTLPTLMRV